MQVISLQSGSNGYSIYVEANSVRLLFDAGISGIQAQKRLAQHGRDIEAVETHSQILGKRLPIYVATRHEVTGVLEV